MDTDSNRTPGGRPEDPGIEHGVSTVPPGGRELGFFGHPRGLSTLFFTEMWERFSYYGMRAILILFMTASVTTGGLGYDASVAGPIYALYTAMVYLLALPGGWFADRVLGQQRSVLFGGIIIMSGHISLAMEGISFFFLGMFLVVLGTGLLKPNISTIVGQLYPEDDNRRDAGFSLFYMGINLGGFIAPLVCGFLAQHPLFRSWLESNGIDPARAWHWGFGAAAVGMFFGIVQYMIGRKGLRGAGLEPGDPMSAGARGAAIFGLLAIIGGGTALILATGGGMVDVMPTINEITAWVLLLMPLAFFAWLLSVGSRNPDERKRHVVILVLFLGAAIFWSAFEQAGSTLNLFAQNDTADSLLGIHFPASWFQSANSAFIIMLAPIFAWLWIKLGRKEPSSPAKFAFGLFFLALGFGILIPAASLAGSGVQVSPMWLVAAYFLHTVGELCLSPVGLSAMTKLAPVRYAGLMLGVWFLASSVGNFIGGNVAGFYGTFTTTQIFGAVTIYVLAACALMIVFVKPIKKMMARR